MKRFALLIAIVGTLAVGCSAQSPLEQILNGIENSSQPAAPGSPQPSNVAGLSLPDSKISQGLKAALEKGTGTAVASTGHVDGYFKNLAIKILLPSYLQSLGKGMRMVGMGQQVDDLELAMNRAAEQAAPAAKPIFIDAITKLTFTDARNILVGSDTAATDYFKKATSQDLTAAFAPIVHRAMENVGVIQQFNQLIDSSPAGAYLGDQNFNLDKYVVGKALDGLFYELGQEEKKIRTNPLAQTTAILKEVFGKK
jgi:uncharacterized protein DUF4197